jgi:hypothetical protein
MRRPTVPEDARACLEVWTTPEAIGHELFVAEGEDAEEVLGLLAKGVDETLTGQRSYRLDEPAWLAQFVLRGSHVGCGYGGLGAEGELLRNTLRQLASHAERLLQGVQDRSQLGARLSVVTALVQALERWDVVSAVVSSSLDREEATRRLAGEPFRFDEHQASHVLDMRVSQRLQGSRSALREEIESLQAALAALT